MPANVFVLGLDAYNRRILDHVPDTEYCRFHPLLSFEEIYGEQISFGGVLGAAQRQLDGFDGTIDAIIGFWDFPVSSLLPLLRKRYGLPRSASRSIHPSGWWTPNTTEPRRRA